MMVCGNGHIIILHCALFCGSLLFKISISQTDHMKLKRNGFSELK